MTQKNYTKPELRNRIKSQVMAGGDGGKPGQWSARKAQLVAQKYEAAGGGYKGPRTGAQKSLAKWTDQKWTTSDGKPAEKADGTMRRYLPEKAWDKLSPGQKAATNKKKVEGSKKGKQFVENTDAAQEARKEAAKDLSRHNVLAHIAGPSGSGKTTLGNLLQQKHPHLQVKDLDDFDDQASAELFGNKRKRDYTDQNIQDLAARRQQLMDDYLKQHHAKPVVLVGHHTEGGTVLKLPTDNRWMLSTSATESARRALRRSQSEAPDHRRTEAELPFDIREARDTIKQLRELGYEKRSPAQVVKAIQQQMGDSAADLRKVQVKTMPNTEARVKAAAFFEEVKLALLAKHKNPEGGLTEAGRRHFERSGESKDLKPGVKKPVDEMSPKDMKRKGSWARRFYGQSPLPPLKKPNGEPTRLALTAKAWGEPVPQNEQQARAIAAKGARLLEMAKNREASKTSAVHWMDKPVTGKFPDMSLPDEVKLRGGIFEKSTGIDRHGSIAHYKENVGKFSRHAYVLPNGKYIIDHRDEWNANKHPIRHLWEDVAGAIPKIIKERLGSSEKKAQIAPHAFASFARDAAALADQESPAEIDEMDASSPYRDSALHKAVGAEQSRMNPAEKPPRADFARAPARTLRSV